MFTRKSECTLGL